MHVRSHTRLTTLAAVGAVALTAVGASAAEGPVATEDQRQVMFVGNNWEGTADVIDVETYERLERIDVIPDREERLNEIRTSPDKLAFYLAVQQGVGEGNDQYTDDMFTDHAGTEVYVSRPSFADVVAISLDTHEILWRFPMDGYRSDHMGISPDGSKLLVSDSTANVVHEIDTETGEETGRFPSGDSPHENEYYADGTRVLHASIGRVYTPVDRAAFGEARDTAKGERYFQMVDADSLEVLQRWDMGERLEAAGHPDMSAAVRPMAIHPDERLVYFQVSFHHGFVEFDLEAGEVLRVAGLPIAEDTRSIPQEQYLLDSAHHGLAIDASGEKLCAAGTMSDYAAIVDRQTFEHTIASEGSKPYWSTNGPDGTTCWVSYSGDDEVAVIDYATATEIARFPVGDHPQRVRNGVIREAFLDGTPAADPAGDPEPDDGAPAADPSTEQPAPAGPSLPATGAPALIGVLGLGSVVGAVALRRRR